MHQIPFSSVRATSSLVVTVLLFSGLVALLPTAAGTALAETSTIPDIGAPGQQGSKYADLFEEWKAVQGRCKDYVLTGAPSGQATIIGQCADDVQNLVGQYKELTGSYIHTLTTSSTTPMPAVQLAELRTTWEQVRNQRFANRCEKYAKGAGAPAGYGAPYEVGGDGDRLIGIRCDTLTGDVAVDVGDGEKTTYVYEKGYQYDMTAKKWVPVTLHTNGEKVGTWFVGSAFADIDLDDTLGAPNQSTWVVGYTCSKESGKWKCGCKDAACTQPGWQVQQIERK